MNVVYRSSEQETLQAISNRILEMLIKKAKAGVCFDKEGKIENTDNSTKRALLDNYTITDKKCQRS